MGDASRAIHIEELMNYSDNLIEILKDDKDTVGLKHFLQQSTALQSQCDKDFSQLTNSIQDYEKKIDSCKQKAAAAESETASDAELDLLQKELQEQQQLERMSREELRVIVNEIDSLELQGDSIEEQRQAIKKFEQNELKAQMKLSMYASVTNIIPNLDDPFNISGHVVEKEKKQIEKFEFDPSKTTAFDICNSIWKMTKS